MGQKKSKETAKSPQTFQYSWEVNRNPPRLKTRQELNIDDFVIKGRRGETIVREPGSVGGQQFVIEDCENCDFFIFDFSAEFSADDCKNCRFFVGPVEGSFFIRTSMDCKAVVACKQFRTRDCSNIDVLLYAQGRPIIEATQNIRIGCFSTFYVGLQDQFKNAKLSVFNNRWNVVHDFTPQSGGGQNYSFLPNTTRESDLLKPFHQTAPNWITEQEEKMNQSQFVVPVTVGPSDTSTKPNVAIVFLPGHSEDAHQFLQSLYTKYADKLSVHDSKEWKLNKQELDTALSKSLKSDELNLLKKDGVKGPIIALAIVDKSEQVGAAAKQCAEGSTSAKSFYLAKSEAESECINNYLFNVHKTET